jgi:glycosyltransferase involved in cell wall biosynthesis
MGNADVGIVPKRGDWFGNEAFSTKTLEFMALGVPVIISATKVDLHYFDSSIVRFFRPGDEDDLSECMFQLAGSGELRQRLAADALNWVSGLCWDRKKHEYFSIIDALVEGRSEACCKKGV